MVKILASGEIVADDDPRAAGGGGAPNRGSDMPRQRQVTAVVHLYNNNRLRLVPGHIDKSQNKEVM